MELVSVVSLDLQFTIQNVRIFDLDPKLLNPKPLNPIP